MVLTDVYKYFRTGFVDVATYVYGRRSPNVGPHGVGGVREND